MHASTHATTMEYPLTLAAILERAATYYPRSEIVSRLADGSLHRETYADLRRRARGLSRGLLERGLTRGDRVATLSWNHHAHLEAYFGVPLAGGVYHTLNLRLSPAELAAIVNDAKDRFLLVDDVLLPLFEAFRGSVSLDGVFVVPISGKPVPPGYESYEALLAPDDPAWCPPAVGENDAAGLCYTSGTTGASKGVAYSHRALVLHTLVSALPDTFGIGQKDTILPVVPMFHANAWGLPFTAALTGSKLVLPGPCLDPASLIDLYDRERITVSGGVPTVWLAILETLNADPSRAKSLAGSRLVIGGAAAPESLIRGLEGHGVSVLHAWGMTELAPLGTVGHVKEHLRDAAEDERYARLAKQGFAAPLLEVRIVGDDGPRPWDGVSPGELQVRGPWVAASYFQKPELRDAWTEDGFFRTGDVATIDDEGYVQITDRIKDLVKSGGEWISSVALENALMGHPAVKEAAVVGVPDAKWGERPVAVVVLRQSAGADELRGHLARTFPKWALPDGFVVRAEIPRTSTGKFKKAQLREELRDLGARVSSPSVEPA